MEASDLGKKKKKTLNMNLKTSRKNIVFYITLLYKAIWY